MGHVNPVVVGERHERLVVLAFTGRDKWNRRLVSVACDCGATVEIATVHFRRSRHCGCEFRKWLNGQAGKRKCGRAGAVRNGRTYGIWKGMIWRCRDAGRGFGYVERGITVCDRWQDYDAFLADMGEAPAGLSIDRINNDGNYEPGNCRWTTQKVQMNNTRRSIRLLINGKSLTVAEAADLLHVKPGTIYSRLSRERKAG